MKMGKLEGTQTEEGTMMTMEVVEEAEVDHHLLVILQVIPMEEVPAAPASATATSGTGNNLTQHVECQLRLRKNT